MMTPEVPNESARQRVNVEQPAWVDVSVTVRDGMPHWPGSPPVVLERTEEISRGDSANTSRLAMGVHTATHMDAPVHFIDGAAGMDVMPLDAVVGEARVIEIADPDQVTVGELSDHQIRPGERVLFRTENSTRCWQRDVFVEDFVFISEAAARYLAQIGVRTVGIDYLSVGGYHDHLPEIHEVLLGAGIWLIEGLDLSAVRAGRYEMICLPIKLNGADGAPARAILRPLDPSPQGPVAP
jgi:arylformamidase